MEIGGAVENAFGADIKKRTKAAEQAVIARAQANKWTGDWVPIEVSPTTGAAIPYTKEGETSTATAPAPAIGVEGTPLPANVSGRSAPGERRVSRAAPGAAAAIGPSLDPTQQFLLPRVRHGNTVEMSLHAPQLTSIFHRF
jgi:hypothetical protein